MKGEPRPAFDALALRWNAERSVWRTGAQRYDAWYDTPKGKAILAIEAACLRPLVERFPRPRLEVGVGTGRFAQALGIEYWLDPAPGPLAIARSRGVMAVQGYGEALPFARGTFGCVLLAFTLCFVADASAVLREAHRVLRPEGGLVMALLLKGTPWASSYAARGAHGHPIYRDARFQTRHEVEALLKKAGFQVTAWRSALFQPPGLEAYAWEDPIEGYNPAAGVHAVGAMPKRRR
jgi:ubiquinone/menaquinone biosynthesis C-methylase UbiE